MNGKNTEYHYLIMYWPKKGWEAFKLIKGNEYDARITAIRCAKVARDRIARIYVPSLMEPLPHGDEMLPRIGDVFYDNGVYVYIDKNPHEQHFLDPETGRFTRKVYERPR